MPPMKPTVVRSLSVTATLSVAVALGLWGTPAAAQVAPPVQIPARPTPAPAATSVPAATIPTVTIIARETAFEAPETVPAGLVTINLRNAAGDFALAQVARLKPGITMAALSAALQAEDEAPYYALVTPAGGVGAIGAGRSQAVTLRLAPGDYILLGFNRAGPILHPFRAVDLGRGEPAAPRADGEVFMRDFSFTVPPLRAGAMTLRVPNVGAQPHEMLIGKLAPGVTMQAVQALEAAGGDALEAGLVELWGGLTAIEGGATAWVQLEFAPGTYGMICFAPDPATGKPHFELGMTSEFTVP